MDERIVDRALLEALRKADPGPYPKRIPYAAPIRQYLPNPVTAFRWATYTAMGTIVLGGMAMVVKAMGIDSEAPPLAVTDLTETDPPPPGLVREVSVPAEVPAAGPAGPAGRAEVAATVASVQPEQSPAPVALDTGGAGDDAAKVSVVPAEHVPRHAAPDVDIDVLGVRVALSVF